MKFVAPMPRHEFFDFLRIADAMLDPFHFGGGNTTFEALSFGIPIVTWPGEFMRGRVTLGCYDTMQVNDLLARNPEEYVALALRAANDVPWATELRACIKDRAGALFASHGAVDEIADWMEAAYRALWQPTHSHEGFTP